MSWFFEEKDDFIATALAEQDDDRDQAIVGGHPWICETLTLYDANGGAGWNDAGVLIFAEWYYYYYYYYYSYYYETYAYSYLYEDDYIDFEGGPAVEHPDYGSYGDCTVEDFEESPSRCY